MVVKGSWYCYQAMYAVVDMSDYYLIISVKAARAEPNHFPGLALFHQVRLAEERGNLFHRNVNHTNTSLLTCGRVFNYHGLSCICNAVENDKECTAGVEAKVDRLHSSCPRQCAAPGCGSGKDEKIATDSLAWRVGYIQPSRAASSEACAALGVFGRCFREMVPVRDSCNLAYYPSRKRRPLAHGQQPQLVKMCGVRPWCHQDCSRYKSDANY